MHVGAPRRQLDHDQVAKGRLVAAQVLGQALDAAQVGALRQADQDRLGVGQQHVAALERRLVATHLVVGARRLVGDREQRRVAGEARVAAEDGLGQ